MPESVLKGKSVCRLYPWMRLYLVIVNAVNCRIFIVDSTKIIVKVFITS